MSDEENFLTRWSRRKREAADERGAPEPGEKARPAESDRRDETVSADRRLPTATTDSEPAFDLSKLPSIESITAETDVRVFLQKGVPADLTRAALRRAWLSDPAIRDFIEIAENQYDFATGRDLPGFGALDISAEEVRKIVAQVFSGPSADSLEKEPEAQPGPETAETPAASETASGRTAVSDAPQHDTATAEPLAVGTSPDTPTDAALHVDIAMQQRIEATDQEDGPAKRSHGGALPR